MRTVRSVRELREALAEPRRQGRAVGLVPTMGAFHEGHLSLMRRARAEQDLVVVSLFVNPAQFNEPRDLSGYPRDEQRDAALAAEQGVDLLFAPRAEEIYPDGFSTTVSVGEVSEPLEGRRRGRAHFDAVATVVTKLFNIVGPDVAYFGQKDAQQTVVIARLVRDLNLPVRLEVCPTVREADGLAMSSRNVHLSPSERRRAASLYRALMAAEEAFTGGEHSPAAVRAAAISQLEDAEPASPGSSDAEQDGAGLELEYLELVDPHTFRPVERITDDVLVLIAARVGATRLIDNHLLRTPVGLPVPAPEYGDASLPVGAAADYDGRP